MNGRPWTRIEIDDLFRTVTQGGDIPALSTKLSRTQEAVIAKARRLRLRVPSDALNQMSA